MFRVVYLVAGNAAPKRSKKMRRIILLSCLVCSFAANAQVKKDSEIFRQFVVLDSTFFERGFNQCDIAYLEEHVAVDLRFFHDKSGFQDRKIFLENTRKYICPDTGPKPIRKVDPNSLELYPLYENGKLYGVIQSGVHRFYLREKGKEDIYTNIAKFTSVWILEGGTWKLTEVLSYDHQDPRR
jgi:hypothetical protein